MRQERSQSTELDREVVAAYATTFIPRYDMYPLQLSDGRYVSVKKRLHLDLVTAHLKGLITIGAYALDEESHARWICFDADDEDGWMRLLGMAACLEREHITPYIEPSRRGGRLWLFTEPVDGVEARRFGQQLLLEHNLETVELFPKQDALTTGPGSLVRLPLGRHRLTGRRYHFITLRGAPLAPTVREQIKLLVRQPPAARGAADGAAYGQLASRHHSTGAVCAARAGCAGVLSTGIGERGLELSRSRSLL
jgi:hypothetical protein